MPKNSTPALKIDLAIAIPVVLVIAEVGLVLIVAWPNLKRWMVGKAIAEPTTQRVEVVGTSAPGTPDKEESKGTGIMTVVEESRMAIAPASPTPPAFSSTTPTPAPVSPAATFGMRLRSEPSLQGAIINTLPDNTVIESNGQPAIVNTAGCNGTVPLSWRWVTVTSTNQSGWVAACGVKLAIAASW